MLHEATLIINPAGSTESERSAWWGSAVLLGFLCPYIFDFIASFFTRGRKFMMSGNVKSDVEMQAKVEEGVEGRVEATSSVTETDSGRQRRVCAGVLVGDFMHNIVDGFFITLNC